MLVEEAMNNGWLGEGVTPEEAGDAFEEYAKENFSEAVNAAGEAKGRLCGENN